MRDGHGDGHDDVAGDVPGAWLPLGLAAKRLGVSRAAIYGRVHRGTLKARPRGNRGIEVWAPDVTGDVGRDGHTDRRGDDHPDITVMLLEERLAAAERERDELRERMVELRVAAGRAEATLEAKSMLLDQMAKLLEDARRPFWRRWLGN